MRRNIISIQFNSPLIYMKSWSFNTAKPKLLWLRTSTSKWVLRNRARKRDNQTTWPYNNRTKLFIIWKRLWIKTPWHSSIVLSCGRKYSNNEYDIRNHSNFMSHFKITRLLVLLCSILWSMQHWGMSQKRNKLCDLADSKILSRIIRTK